MNLTKEELSDIGAWKSTAEVQLEKDAVEKKRTQEMTQEMHERLVANVTQNKACIDELEARVRDETGQPAQDHH